MSGCSVGEIRRPSSREVKCFVLLTEEYEAYMKKQDATFKTEVTAVVQEPKVGDVPPVVVTTMEQMTTTIISGQVDASLAMVGVVLHSDGVSGEHGTLHVHMDRLNHQSSLERTTIRGDDRLATPFRHLLSSPSEHIV